MTTRTSTLTRLGLGLGLAAGMILARGGASTARALAAEAIPIDNDDIGGVVTGAAGPEAGVWVIAETTDLPTQVRPDRGDRRSRALRRARPSEGELQRLGARLRARGLAEGARPRPGKALNLTAVAAPNAARGRGVLPGGLLVLAAAACPTRASSRARAAGNGIAPRMKSQAEWLRQLKSGGCTACHQLGTRRRARSPKPRHVRVLGGGVGAAHPVRPGRRQHAQRARPARRRGGAGDVRRLDRPDRGRRGAAGAAAAAGPRAQRRHHAVGLGRSRRRISTTRSRPTGAIRPLNANGPIYGALELSADYLPVLDPVQPHRQPGAADGPRSEHAARGGAGRCRSLRRTGATKPIWTSRNNVHNPMFDQQGPGLDHLGRAPAGQPGRSARRARAIRRRSCSRSPAPAGTSRCTTRRRRSSRTSARASARTT